MVGEPPPIWLSVARWLKRTAVTTWRGGPADAAPPEAIRARLARLEPDGTLTPVGDLTSALLVGVDPASDDPAATVIAATADATPLLYQPYPPVARLFNMPTRPTDPDPLGDLAGPHDDPAPVLGHCNARWGVVHRCCRPDLHQPKAGVLEHLCGCGITVVE